MSQKGMKRVSAFSVYIRLNRTKTNLILKLFNFVRLVVYLDEGSSYLVFQNLVHQWLTLVKEEKNDHNPGREKRGKGTN
jgi:hypothetical protein